MAPTNGHFEEGLETDGHSESYKCTCTVGHETTTVRFQGQTTNGCIVTSPTDDETCSTIQPLYTNVNITSDLQTVDSSTGLDLREINDELNHIADNLNASRIQPQKRTKSTIENGVSKNHIIKRAFELDMLYRRLAKNGVISENESFTKLLIEMVQVIFALEAENYFLFYQDYDGDTKLHILAIFKLETIALTIIDLMSDYSMLDTQNRLFQTPLILSVLLDMPKLARRLMSCGVEIDARDYDGNTALHIACRDRNFKMAELLTTPIKHEEVSKNKSEIPYRRVPQDLSIMNFEGTTCIELAFINKDIRIIDLLLDKGADVNQRCLKSGRTLLYRACLGGDIKIVEYLIRKQCDINMRAYDGSTSFDAARASGQWQIAVMLAERGAESDSDYDG